MKLSFSRVCIPLSAILLATTPVLAQPDAGSRGIVALPEAKPLTLEELQNLTGGPTLVTARADNLPTDKIVEIFKQAAGNTGTALTNIKDPTPLSVDWQEVPFWEAAREVEDLTGQFWFQEPQGVLNLRPYLAAGPVEPGLDGLLVADTPFVKIYANSISHNVTLQTSLSPRKANVPPTADGTLMNLMVYLDPKIRVESGSLQIAELRMGPGNVTPLAHPSARVFDLFRSRAAPLPLISPLTLALPPDLRSGTVLPKVAGTVRMAVVTQSQKWKIDDLLAAQEAAQTVGTVHYTLVKTEVVGNQLKLHIEVEQDAQNRGTVTVGGPPALVVPGMQPEPPRAVTVGPAVAVGEMFAARGKPVYVASSLHVPRILDGQGRQLYNSGSTSTVQPAVGNRVKTKTEMTFNLAPFNGEPANGPFSMEWSFPITSRNLDIPFEMHDIAVP
jgi:hypothetical protein